MKKVFALFVVLAMITALFVVPGTTFAAKPAGNLAGAHTYAWHLSNDVMPMPPYGYGDIPGSDTGSKLIVNQPNGNTEVTITGVMNGLTPSTEYTVYPSNAWSTSEEWNIVGDWNLTFMYGGAYNHHMTVTFQNMSTGVFSGNGHSTQYPGTVWTIQGTSHVTDDTIYLDLIYTGDNPGYTVNAVGTIDADGHIVAGNWSSSANQNGTWSSVTGTASKVTVGNGWPGLFPGQKAFTFTTDAYGSGSWHLNLRDEDFAGPDTYRLSVWINGGGRTILISDNFDVVVD